MDNVSTCSLDQHRPHRCADSLVLAVDIVKVLTTNQEGLEEVRHKLDELSVKWSKAFAVAQGTITDATGADNQRSLRHCS